MPRKIRQIKADLRRAGFVLLLGRGKGDHTMYQHPDVADAIVGLDGKDGDDAKRYMEQSLRVALAKVAEAGQAKREGGA